MKRVMMLLCAVSIVAYTNPAAGAGTTAPSRGLPAIGASIPLTFRTSVQTPTQTSTSTGTVTITRTGPTALAITVSPDNASPQTVHILLTGDGSYGLDPAYPAPASTNSSDPQVKAAAKALFGQLALAAKVVSNVQKLQGSGPFDVQLNLTPVGNGIAIPTVLHMSPAPATGASVVYQGQVQGQTTTTLPAGSMEQQNKKKEIGESAVVGVAISPVAALATRAAMHAKDEQTKKKLSQPLPDAVQLVVNAHFTPGPSAQVSGTQYDTLSVSGHSATIVTTWSFSQAAPTP